MEKQIEGSKEYGWMKRKGMEKGLAKALGALNAEVKKDKFAFGLFSIKMGELTGFQNKCGESQFELCVRRLHEVVVPIIDMVSAQHQKLVAYQAANADAGDAVSSSQE